ncbi:MAG: hypothetical protein ABIO46_02115 [Chitinophagales bacterium]
MTSLYQTQPKKAIILSMAFISFWFLQSSAVMAYSVSQLKATYRNGQVFLTWKNPSVANLQYNVYRSTTPLLTSSQLNTQTFLGFVRDNSSKNIQLSQDTQEDLYYKIEDDGAPLAANEGLYVVTCTGVQLYYYAVTVKNLSNNKEAKSLTLDKNTLLLPVIELVTKPQPVFQDSIQTAGNDVKHQYVQFGNNQETSLYPALNSTGSYGFNFYLVKRGNAASYPLVIVYEGEGAVAGGGAGLDGDFTNCYVLGVNDWLPIPDNQGNIGDNSRYCCYHENFNIYSKNNPIPTTGVIKTYPQRRYIEAIHWAASHFPIDAGKIYLKGTSSTGFGALLTAAIIPEEIAAVYAVVEPLSIKPNPQSVLEQMWGLGSSKLNTDILNWKTQIPLTFPQLTDMVDMAGLNELREVPLIFDVHGKGDNSVGWTSGKIEWFDSLQMNHYGGVIYWDQREHNGNNKDFLSEETTPDFFRYATYQSYPAFSNCSINQNPGNGSPNNGDPYGALNGYLDWQDDITDENCNYTIHVLVKDLYVGGAPDPEQYNTCKTDITFRRFQQFHPNAGASIKWKNFNSSNSKIQSGTVNYNGGLITLKDITVNKSGNRIELKLVGCLRTGEETEDIEDASGYFIRSATGYAAHIYSNEAEKVVVTLYDLTGRKVMQQSVFINAGDNTFNIPFNERGIFVIEVKGKTFNLTDKLLF